MPQSILVIEDDLDAGHLMTWTLSAVGHRAQLVHSRDDALFHLRTSAFDIVLMDYGMPGMTAEAFLEMVRAKWPATKVVLITAADGAKPIAEKLSTDGVITKPFDPVVLSKKLASI